ncbi:MAG TPA: GGDEF domain-containing protein [Pseudomonadota bacterium]|nr:GGDEF domain-containing protein [Pseudomonadota bacterium]
MVTISNTGGRLINVPLDLFVQGVVARCIEWQLSTRNGPFHPVFFEEVSITKVEQVQCYGGVLSLIRFDVDHFKQIDELLGPDEADELLLKLGRILGNRRRTDCAARLGGQEFGMILMYTDRQSALHQAELLRQAIEEKLSAWVAERTGRPDEKVTASFGVATYEATAADADEAEQPDPIDVAFELNRQADQLQRLAKIRGRNRVEWDLATVTPEEQAQLALDVKPVDMCRDSFGLPDMDLDLSAPAPLLDVGRRAEAVASQDQFVPLCRYCGTSQLEVPARPTSFLESLKRIVRSHLWWVVLLFVFVLLSLLVAKLDIWKALTRNRVEFACAGPRLGVQPQTRPQKPPAPTNERC